MENLKKKRLIIILAAVGIALIGIGIFLYFHFRKAENPIAVENPKAEVVDEDGAANGNVHLHAGEYYRLIFNHDTAFILLEAVEEHELSGKAYLLQKGSDCVSPMPFSVAFHNRTTRVVVDEKEITFKLRSRQVRDCLDGEHHLISTSENKSYNVMITNYCEPPFLICSSNRYRKEIYPVQCFPNINFGRVRGYWTSLVGNENDSYARIVKEGLKNTLLARDLDLDMDLYLPNEGADTLIPNHSHRIRRPLILFLHGGAFYVGDKSDQAIAQWCRHFAAMGYAAASINYRMGYLPTKKDIERTGYMATQDAHAAMRFLVANADDYLIDTTRLFVAGASAGAITALNVAFMRNRNRPDASFGKEGNPSKDLKGTKKSKERKQRDDDTTARKERLHKDDLGRIQSAGNDINTSFHVLAVANMWGAVYDLNMLKNSRTAIVSFHGDADQLVPYDHGYPFSDISDRLGHRLFNQMYGSASIHARANELGLKSKLYTFPGAGHALHLNEDRSINTANFNFIRDSVTEFFYQVMVPCPAHVEPDPYNPRHFYVDNPNIVQVFWKVQGGFVVQASDTDVWVVWREDDPDKREVFASGYYLNTIPFYVALTLPKDE